VADRGDGFSRLKERLHEPHGSLVLTQLVGIHHTTGQEQRVVLVGAGALERHIDADLIAPMVMLPRIDGLGLWRDERRARARRIERLPRFDQLDLFHAIRRQDGDALPVELLCCHLLLLEQPV